MTTLFICGRKRSPCFHCTTPHVTRCTAQEADGQECSRKLCEEHRRGSVSAPRCPKHLANVVNPNMPRPPGRKATT